MSRRDQIEKDKQALLAKPWVKNHPIFTYDHIAEFYEMFVLYAEPRTKKADVRDILVTAKTLGLTDKFPIIAHALDDLASSYDDAVDFETFISDLTAKLGHPFDQKGRVQLFKLIDVDGKGTLDKGDLHKISEELRFNLTEDDIEEIIHNVAGYEAEDVSEEKFEKYLGKRVQRRQVEQEIYRNK
ncbi:unnamed protein product (macronuclear) [Paramecium tetraurelia]|uniref:EF-hand domain-containing protein n=1 Tax=Paramecium tetraurelia TaxID=5888 RepID=A0C3G3_PARTE|nr:uncharacterized protein GSPATT00034809001 [Paramecium tetraurelia]CAK65330.1 unnamed protein product [Paramecium tetraurelia]|eukprot:XP_001432727.1 hypothetical protein (macronuclear) [Paramecium tetraurelia strain d4-2]